MEGLLRFRNGWTNRTLRWRLECSCAANTCDERAINPSDFSLAAYALRVLLWVFFVTMMVDRGLPAAGVYSYRYNCLC